MAALLACLALLAVALAAEKKGEGPVSDLSFTVVKAANGKPVRNASVILHPVDARGRQSNAGFQLKTDAEGHAAIAGVPYGKLRIQVIASGFQTYGQDFDVNQAAQHFDIRLNPPQPQHTIY
jgi:hypothetical protein